MKAPDTVRFAFSAIAGQKLRSFLTVLGIAVGIAAVVLLTSIGEGIQRYIITEFTQFGTNLIGIVPGKTSTFGMSAAVIDNVRPLTLEDEQALSRINGVTATVPVVQGNAAVKSGVRQRRTTILGVGPAAPEVWQLTLAFGQFLPPDDYRTARPFVVLGSKIREELFSRRNPLGEIVRIGSARFRVVGVMESKGQVLGFDMDDAVYIPAARALELFNRESLMEIDVVYGSTVRSDRMARAVRTLLINRHGREDFTITTQDQMLEVLGAILDKLTLAVAALGAISLLVGAVGITTIMTIAVHDRTAEIGLLAALGATRTQILGIFLGEAIMLAMVGGTLGLAAGWGGSRLIHALVPALPTHVSPLYMTLSLVLSAIIGVSAGVFPARRAARLDPVQSLMAE